MRSLPAAIVLVTALTIGLTGCVPQTTEGPPEPPASETPSASTPPPSAQPSETPTPTASDEPDAGYQSKPVDIACGALVGPQAVYDYNPNYSLQPRFTPAAGTAAATIVANQGVGCSWVNQTSGVTFVVAVAQLAPDDLASIAAGLTSSSTPVSGVGDSAFFAASGGVGAAEVISGSYWLVATSPAFYGIADAKPLLEAALTSLGE